MQISVDNFLSVAPAVLPWRDRDSKTYPLCGVYVSEKGEYVACDRYAALKFDSGRTGAPALIACDRKVLAYVRSLKKSKIATFDFAVKNNAQFFNGEVVSDVPAIDPAEYPDIREMFSVSYPSKAKEFDVFAPAYLDKVNAFFGGNAFLKSRVSCEGGCFQSFKKFLFRSPETGKTAVLMSLGSCKIEWEGE